MAARKTYKSQNSNLNTKKRLYKYMDTQVTWHNISICLHVNLNIFYALAYFNIEKIAPGGGGEHLSGSSSLQKLKNI